MKFAFILFSLALVVSGAESNLYPEIRKLISEAEQTAADIAALDDGSQPRVWASKLYARAGYLDQAAKALGGTNVAAYTLWKAQTIYGDFAGARKNLDSISDPLTKAQALNSSAEVLWRMGQSDKARAQLDAAKAIGARIANPLQRSRALDSIRQTASYIGDDPPEILSAKPNPQPNLNELDSPKTRFPVTPEGFEDLKSSVVDRRVKANSALMTELYLRIAAKDLNGLVSMVETERTPFQAALVLASIEHLLIQSNKPEPAEQFAIRIPELDAPSVLAKAEALSAVGAAWLRAEDADRAHFDFQAAIALVKSAKGLLIGKVSVMISIATAQASGGMVANAADSLDLAQQLATGFPLRPKVGKAKIGNATAGKATAGRKPAKVHYRDEVYDNILLAAIRTHDLGVARKTAELWRRAGGRNSVAIVDAWMNAGQNEEALSWARHIERIPERVHALLFIAQRMLDQAGAPNL